MFYVEKLLGVNLQFTDRLVMRIICVHSQLFLFYDILNVQKTPLYFDLWYSS